MEKYRFQMGRFNLKSFLLSLIIYFFKRISQRMHLIIGKYLINFYWLNLSKEYMYFMVV